MVLIFQASPYYKWLGINENELSNRSSCTVDVGQDYQDDDEEEELNIEFEVDQGEAPPENAIQRIIGALGFQAAAAAADAAQNAEAGVGEPLDLFDFAYTIFRISFMVAICVSYASWQRIALVAAVAFYFYW